MTYEKALESIRAEFDTRKEAAHCEIIKTGLTYNGCNGFCVALYSDNERGIMLTDLGETKEIFDEVTEDEWRSIAEEAGCRFRNWRLERDYNGMDDVYAFIKLLDDISERFFDIDD